MNILGHAGTGPEWRKPSPGLAVSITEMPFGASTRQATAVDTFERSAQAVPGAGDVFQKVGAADNPFAARTPGAETAAVRAPEETLKTLLQDDNPGRRQEAAASFFMHATGIPLSGAQGSLLQESEKADLKALAQNLQLMSARQKVDLMRELTGDQSRQAQLAEKMLVHQQPPGLNDVFRMSLPDPQQMRQEGAGTAMRALGIGLLMMPILCPATLLFRPELAGQLMASAALPLL